jgi:hypothetical protein
MSSPILSRFDLLFILIDKPDEELDKLLSEHVMMVSLVLAISVHTVIAPSFTPVAKRPKRSSSSLEVCSIIFCTPQEAVLNIFSQPSAGFGHGYSTPASPLPCR